MRTFWRTSIMTPVLVAGLLLAGFVLWNQNISPAQAADTTDIDRQIEEKKKEIEKLEQETASFKKAIVEKQAEEKSLTNQIAILDDSISSKNAEISKKQQEIDLVNLEIEELEAQIEQKVVEIGASKENLSSTVASLYMLEQTTQLEVVMSTKSFSDFFSKVEYTTTVEEGTKKALDTLHALKAALDEQNENLHTKQSELETYHKELENARYSLQHEQDSKEGLLASTQQDEATFQRLIEERQSTQSEINAAVSKLERERRARQQNGDTEVVVGDTDWVWPVSGRVITTYFMDPNYVFNQYFRHAAIDVDGEQGDPIYATNSGTVTAVHFNGLSFAFVIIDHGNGFSSLYGHPNAIYVSVGDTVEKGEVIAAMGGTPGTPGAGSLTTGSHLHFAMYQNGAPVDPLNYLP